MKQNGTTGKAVGNPFAALRHKNFLLFWTGMAISTMGMWMQSTAQPWLALRLTDSAFLLSLVSALQFAPVLVLTLFAGVLVDRFPKKNILLLTQTASLAITLILAVLDITGRVTYWHLIVTSTLTGIVNAFDMPARQSFVIELVGKEDLTNGIALNSVQYNMARIAGPALAGVIMAAWGTSACFLLNAASFLAVIAALIFVKPLALEKAIQEKRGIFRNIGDGLTFIFKRPQMYMPLLFIAIAATFAMNFSVTIPVFAKQVLLLEETGYGFLMSATGIGALAGALAMAALSRGGPRDVYIYMFPIIVGALLVGTGLSGDAVVAAIILAVISFFYMIFMSSVNTTLQSGATDEYRGRVVSVYSLVVSGSTPLGNIFAGAVSQHWGARAGFVVSGALIVVLLLALLALQKRRKRA